MDNAETDADDRTFANNVDLLDADATCRFFGGSRPINPATLYRGVKAGRYPRPIKVGPGMSRWIKSECEEARQHMIAERDAGQQAA